MNIRSILNVACLAACVAAAPAAVFAEDDKPYFATGVPNKPLDEDAKMNFLSTSTEARWVVLEFARLLDEIAEREFSEWCAFNGFDGPATTGMNHSFPCRHADGYRAVRIDDTVRLFKQDKDRMIRLETFVTRESDLYKLVDFADVRRAFALRDK